jgi:hypothetical protein
MQSVRCYDQIRSEALATLGYQRWDIWFERLDPAIEIDLASSLSRTFQQPSVEVGTVGVPRFVRRWMRKNERAKYIPIRRAILLMRGLL